MNGKDLPDSVRMGQRLTGMSANQATLPLAGLASSSSPGTASAAPGSASCCRTRPRWPTTSASSARVYTEAINHDPAITFFQTGSQIAGRPCMGSWLSYGLGSDNENLPAFVVLISPSDQSTSRSTRASGATASCPRVHQGVQFRAGQGPGALPRQPAGVSPAEPPQDARPPARAARDAVRRPCATRRSTPAIAQYEMAYRMQTSVPEVMDLSKEPRPRLRPLRPRRAKARHLRRQLPAGPPAGRARRPVHPALSPRLGPPRRPARRHPPANAGRPTRPAPR